MKVTIHAGSIGTNVSAETAHVYRPQATDDERPIVRALVLGANPGETPRLRLDEELRSIDEAIRRGRYNERFELAVQLAVRTSDLPGHLMRYQPDIVHFAGHGETGGLIVEDRAGRARRLEAADLCEYLERLGGRVRCVVLNACLTHAQAELLARYVPAVIGMSRPIDDPAAIEFAIGFYETLSYGERVETAFQVGRRLFTHGDRCGQRRDLDGTVNAPAQAPAVPMLFGKGDLRFF